MTDLMELASRVGAGEGPDRELDAAIVRALCPDATVGEYIAGDGGDIVFHAEAIGIRNKDACPAYTASLDAALSLVPEGWAIDNISMWPASPEGTSDMTPAQSSVSMVGTSLERWGRKMVWGHSGKNGRAEADAATPALALTAAALRARAHQGTAHVEQ